MLILYIFFLAIRSSDLEDFISKDIRIFLSSANHVLLGLDTDNYTLTGHSKHSSYPNFASAARLSEDESGYSIQFQDYPICADGDKVIKCNDIPEVWKIKEKAFGFTINIGFRCLTYVKDDEVRLENCTDANNQIFDFERIVERKDEPRRIPLEKPRKNLVVVSLNNPSPCPARNRFCPPNIIEKESPLMKMPPLIRMQRPLKKRQPMKNTAIINNHEFELPRKTHSIVVDKSFPAIDVFPEAKRGSLYNIFNEKHEEMNDSDEMKMNDSDDMKVNDSDDIFISER